MLTLQSVSPGQASQAIGTARVRVFEPGDDITAPVPIPPSPISVASGKCKDRSTGITKLSFIVDETGAPRNITFLAVQGNDMDKLALRVLDSDRFKPALRGGAAVPVWQTAEVEATVCTDRSKDAAGKKVFTVRPGSQLAQRFGALPSPPAEAVLAPSDDPATWPDPVPSSLSGDAEFKIRKVNPKNGISAPAVLNNINAVFSDLARKRRIQGVCLITTIVDRHGLPQNIRVVRPLGYGLDENAVDAVSRYRFKPAMKEGVEPVPVLITIEVNFRLY